MTIPTTFPQPELRRSHRAPMRRRAAAPRRARPAPPASGGTDFLTLMLAQLKNQDPTSPVDSNTFLSQLASLSEVQGITQPQHLVLGAVELDGLEPGAAGVLLARPSSAGEQLDGDAGDRRRHDHGCGGRTADHLRGDAEHLPTAPASWCSRSISARNRAGLANFSWNGTQGDGSQAPPGQYTLTAQVAGVASGTAVGTYVNGTVQSVTMGAGTHGAHLERRRPRQCAVQQRPADLELIS